jgi:hypothetical protein
VCMRLFCVRVVLCVGRGLATGRLLVQGVLPSVNKITKLNKGPGPNKRAVEPLKKKKNYIGNILRLKTTNKLTPQMQNPKRHDDVDNAIERRRVTSCK